jgi:hypothetical protein
MCRTEISMGSAPATRQSPLYVRRYSTVSNRVSRRRSDRLLFGIHGGGRVRRVSSWRCTWTCEEGLVGTDCMLFECFKSRRV